MCLDSRGIVALPDDGGLVAALFQMPVDAVPGDVEHAVLEPFDRDIAGREGGVLDLGEGLDPADALGLFGPEAVGILDRARVHVAVFGLVDPGALGPFRRHIVNFLGHRIPPRHAARERDRPPSSLLKSIMRRALMAPTSATDYDLRRGFRAPPDQRAERSLRVAVDARFRPNLSPQGQGRMRP